MTCPETVTVGAYILGALDADERFEAEQHIRDCEHCLDALLRFAHLPGLLHALTLEDVAPPAPDLKFDPSLDYELDFERSIADIPRDHPDPTPAATVSPVSSPTISRRLPRRRVLIASAAAAIVLLVGGLIGHQLVTDSAPQEEDTITWSATDGVGGIDTTARMTRQTWGTDIRLQIRDSQPGAVCMLVVHARNGAAEITGWWAANNVPEADVPASTSIPLADIDRVQVVSADRKVLSTLTESTQ